MSLSAPLPNFEKFQKCHDTRPGALTRVTQCVLDDKFRDYTCMRVAKIHTVSEFLKRSQYRDKTPQFSFAPLEFFFEAPRTTPF